MKAERFLFFAITTGNSGVISKQYVIDNGASLPQPRLKNIVQILDNLEVGQYFYAGPLIIVGITEEIK